MKKKIWIGIVLFIVIIVAIIISIMGVERSITKKTLQERQVSSTEVKDITSPVITLKGNKEMTIKQGEKYQEPGYSATDNIDGSIVNKVTISKQVINDKQYKLIYRVRDEAGNVGQAERIINIEQSAVINQSNTEKNEQINTNTQNNQTSNTNTGTNTQTTKPSTTTNNKPASTNTTTTDKNNTTKNQNTATSDEKGVIYLTFDDGPSNSSTPKILDILKKHNVKATFFLLNYNSNTEALVKREVAEGHSIGIHGYSHDYKKIYTSEEAYMENLNKLQSKIYKSTGVKTTITRFPGGSSNTISKFNPGIMTRLSKLVVQNGYTYYDWNVDSNDAGGAKNADAVYNNVTKNLSKKWRNIVLMHDFSGNTKTINALEKIIEYGKKNGYTFKTITADTRMMKHGINN